MEPLFDDGTITLFVDIEAASLTRRLPINGDAKANGRFLAGRPHDQMKIARVKTKRNPAIRTAQDRRLPAHRPLADERPLIERQASWERIEATSVQLPPPGRNKVLRPLVAEVRFRRSQVARVRRRLQASAVDRHQALA